MAGTDQHAVGGITVAERDDSTVAHLWGEIDEALREQASIALSRALTRDLPVVLDAAQVTFIDSTGIAFLIQFMRVGREEGLPVTLRNPPSLVTDVLELLGLQGLFDASGDESTITAT
ncbi:MULTISPECIES: STAS domain-containing protein [unclassified Actinotalea]|uniref:STAS domain-containing protein n=1 Tax=unclassified Actinotalea TaxID=2638618 RepID=UPI0015F761EB|nr:MULTISPECIES: STAS domain-containing protein [unclassified Actinotalea]